MSSLNGISANTSGMGGINSQLLTGGTGAAKSFEQMSPVEQGNFLRQQDKIGGGMPDARLIAGNAAGVPNNSNKSSDKTFNGFGIPVSKKIDCSEVPKDLVIVTKSLNASFHAVLGATGSLGTFDGADLKTGKVYHGNYATIGGGVGGGGGLGASGGITNIGSLQGQGADLNLSLPVVSGGMTFGTDGNISGASGGPGAKLGINSNITYTVLNSCTVAKPF